MEGTPNENRWSVGILAALQRSRVDSRPHMSFFPLQAFELNARIQFSGRRNQINPLDLLIFAKSLKSQPRVIGFRLERVVFISNDKHQCLDLLQILSLGTDILSINRTSGVIERTDKDKQNTCVWDYIYGNQLLQPPILCHQYF